MEEECVGITARTAVLSGDVSLSASSADINVGANSKGVSLNHLKEVAITLKDDERRMTHKFLIYQPFDADPQDETVERCIKEAMESFKGSPDVVKVKIIFEC